MTPSYRSNTITHYVNLFIFMLSKYCINQVEEIQITWAYPRKANKVEQVPPRLLAILCCKTKFHNQRETVNRLKLETKLPKQALTKHL